ncbi:MAG: aminodeoxychorismate/anthranilate synthase component II, partial [Pseudomonadota bacterium]
DLGATCRVYRNDEISVEAVLAEEPSAIVLSPGPCTPDDAGICLDLVRAAVGKVPMFGVCLGYQAIGQALGGTITSAPSLMHGKRSNVVHEGAGVFRGLPSPLRVTRYHSLVLDRTTLPACLEPVAETEDGLLMGVAHRDAPVHGVLFHPESIASEAGHALLANFLDAAGIPRVKDIPEVAIPARVA